VKEPAGCRKEESLVRVSISAVNVSLASRSPTCFNPLERGKFGTIEAGFYVLDNEIEGCVISLRLDMFQDIAHTFLLSRFVELVYGSDLVIASNGAFR
jgi:hypothetical protein